MTLTLRAAKIDPAVYPCQRSEAAARLWHGLLRRRLWDALPLPASGRGVGMGLEWRNCPKCQSTLTKRIVVDEKGERHV